MLWEGGCEYVARAEFEIFEGETGSDVTADECVRVGAANVRCKPRPGGNGSLPAVCLADDDLPVASIPLDHVDGYRSSAMVVPDFIRADPVECREICIRQEIVDGRYRGTRRPMRANLHPATKSLNKISAFRVRLEVELRNEMTSLFFAHRIFKASSRCRAPGWQNDPHFRAHSRAAFDFYIPRQRRNQEKAPSVFVQRVGGQRRHKAR